VHTKIRGATNTLDYPILMGHWAKRGIDFELIGPTRAAVPIPRQPAARIKRAYKLRQQPVEPRERDLPGGSFLWRSRRNLKV